jgi:hypothetical protein
MENKKLTPHFFFLSIGVLGTLIATVTSFINLIFSALDHVFPDVLNASYQYGYVSYSFDSMRSALAVLIIVFPVFLILSRFWSKAMKGEMAHWDAVIRKWAIYLILFLASVAVIADLVTLVRYFVSGEITIRFILKVLAVLVVALFVGVYYIFELKNKEKMWGCKVGTWAAIKSSVLVVALIVWSFCVMGSPFQQRSLRLDQRRIDDLQNIQWQVISYWQQKEKLPEALADLKNPLAGYSLPTDPEFEKGNVYEYKKLDKMKFEICATFILPIPKGWVENNYKYGFGGDGIMPARDVAMSSMPYPAPSQGESWDHEAGRSCFQRTIDPDLYPPYPKPTKY